jgi:predicted 2-oxoglutarate/Fe(II)-dependent dioxygenase YbiX
VVARLETVRDEIGRAFGMTLTGAEGPGFLRYLSGGLYRAHQDTLDAGVDASAADAERFPRRLSVVLFLTGSNERGATPANACTGGVLRLHGTAGDAVPLDLTPTRGLLAAFPSPLVHEVLPVTSGVRDVIVDWFY